MKYFNSLPLILKKDYNNNDVVVSNILARNYFLPNLVKNFSIFYDYNIKEGDTPENIAYRYYDDVYRYWIVLYSNNILDPQSQWPLSTNEFDLYLQDKYKDVGGQNVLAYTLATVHHYEKTIYTSDSTNLQEQSTTIQIDENTYNILFESETTKVVGGITYTMRVSKKAVSIYDYELSVNESKRKINLLKKDYAYEAESEFRNLMA